PAPSFCAWWPLRSPRPPATSCERDAKSVGFGCDVEPSDRVIAFGPYRLDPGSGRLLRGDTNVPLRLKAFAVPEYLATHPRRPLPRDELLDGAGPEPHASPSVLAGCVCELRRALHDAPKDARFIEPASRRGSRFIASPPATPATAEASDLT